jgi:putative ABC transport system permease protein
LPDEGLLLSRKLAEILDIRIGETVTVHFLEGQRWVVQVPVAALADDPVGVGAYMALPSLNRLLREDERTLSGGLLAVDALRHEALFKRLKQLPVVRGVSVKSAMLANFRDTIARTLRLQTLINIVFAGVIAFGVVYNSVRIALSERAHELASLRVLGFTRREIAAMLLGEQALLTLATLPAGFGLGFGIVYALVSALNRTETFRLPLVLSPQTFAFAAVVVATAAVLSGLLIWGRIRRLDLVPVLKTRE